MTRQTIYRGSVFEMARCDGFKCTMHVVVYSPLEARLGAHGRITALAEQALGAESPFRA